MYIMARKILITFVGMKDPYPADDDAPGPILSLLKIRQFDELYVLCAGAGAVERAKDLEEEMRAEKIAARLNVVDFPLEDLVSYEEIWRNLETVLATIDQSMSSQTNEWSFLLDSGTPQMKSCLLLAGKTGRYRVRLLQGIPPYYAQGAYRVRDITDATPSLPVQRAPMKYQMLFQGEPDIGDAAMCHEATVAEALYAHHGEAGEPDRGIIATSGALREALERAERAARYNEPVLILGETGTGKTMLARYIHEQSRRSHAPFIELNCSAIPEGLAESTLFGHERGAFTGADRAKTGALRSADKGTLFLDEVGDLPPFVQAKLLKAIEDQTFYPVGADHPVTVDVRIIAATNSDLKQKIAQGSFRRDLYERLNVIAITIPPLRQRKEDIEALVRKTLAMWNKDYGEHKYLTEEAHQLLLRYTWPGNVRELLNAVRSAAATAPHDTILPDHLPSDVRSMRPARAQETPPVDLPEDGIDLRARMLQIEWEYFARALRQSHGNCEAAARLLGLTGHSFRKALRGRFASFVQSEGWDEE